MRPVLIDLTSDEELDGETAEAFYPSFNIDLIKVEPLRESRESSCDRSSTHTVICPLNLVQVVTLENSEEDKSETSDQSALDLRVDVGSSLVNIPTVRRDSEDVVNFECDSDADERQRNSTPPPLLDPYNFNHFMTPQEPCCSKSIMTNLSPSIRDFIYPPARRTYRKSSITKDQTDTLRKYYDENPALNAIQILDIERETKLSKDAIRRWFRSQPGRVQKEQNNIRKQAGQQQHQSTNLTTPTGNFSGAQFPSTSTNTTPPSQNNSPPADIIPINIRIKKRMDSIPSVSEAVLKRELNNCIPKIKCLINFYIKGRMGMRDTLLAETDRLKEITSKVRPYASRQDAVMLEWRKGFFDKLVERVHERKKQTYIFISKQIISVWLPLLIYGLITGLSLKNAIRDFAFKPRINNDDARPSLDYKIPSLLSYLAKKL